MEMTEIVRRGLRTRPMARQIVSSTARTTGKKRTTKKKSQTRRSQKKKQARRLQSKRLPTAKKSGKVNLNTASRKELTMITGVGDKLAQKIVRHRQRHGRFKSIRDVGEIPGFNEQRLNQVREQAKV